MYNFNNEVDESNFFDDYKILLSTVNIYVKSNEFIVNFIRTLPLCRKVFMKKRNKTFNKIFSRDNFKTSSRLALNLMLQQKHCRYRRNINAIYDN